MLKKFPGNQGSDHSVPPSAIPKVNDPVAHGSQFLVVRYNNKGLVEFIPQLLKKLVQGSCIG